MVLRFILRLLTNNDHLVQRLSESYPIRKAAQWVVVFFYRGKGFIEDSKLTNKITPEQFRSFIRRFSENIKAEIKQGKDQFKK